METTETIPIRYEGVSTSAIGSTEHESSVVTTNISYIMAYNVKIRYKYPLCARSYSKAVWDEEREYQNRD